MFALVGCSQARRQESGSRLLPGWRSLLGPIRLTIDELPTAPFVVAAPAQHTLVIVDQAHDPGAPSCNEAQRAALRDFVAAGGRLCLFGHAAALVATLGFEAEAPEASGFRWGFDNRALEGSARLGLRLVSGRAPELFEGLPADGGENVFYLAGGAPCEAALCGWSIGLPQQGEVLARLQRLQDGAATTMSMPVLVRWRPGNGEVIACGLLPAVDHDDALVRDTARGFVQRCLGDGRQLTIFVCPDRAPPPAVVATWPRSASMLAHTGWRAALDVDAGGVLRSPEEMLQQVVTPSWQSGADVLELELTTADGSLPLPWPQDDPIAPPGSWRGGARPPWSRRAFASFAAELHGRSMLTLGCLDPLPVGERPTERLVALRFVARELAGLRRLDGGAFDGFGVGQWWPDRDGFGVSMLQDFQPAAVLYRTGERVPVLAGGLRALDADDGAPRGSAAAGLSATWRAGFPAELFPIGVLDARAEPDVRPVVVRGGGAEADWIVTQANDFVRERIGRGGTMLWRRHDPRSLAADTAAYVEAMALEPLRAAVAMPLAATGRDGRRAAAAAGLPATPAGFATTVAEPAATHVLQNNWLRLSGSGGRLEYDPSGLARFGGTGSQELSPGFVRSRLFGGRPAADAVRSERLDLLGTHRRGEGGYPPEVRVALASADRAAPGVLASGEAPAWPQAVLFEWRGTPGYHELELLPRAVRGAGVLRVALDDTTLRCVPFRLGERAESVVVPVHLARQGLRHLRLEVLEGGALALDRLELRRAGDVGVEAAVVVPAGSRAELAETACSSYHAERVSMTTVADLPGLVLRFGCERAVRNLQVERTFRLPGRTLLGGDDSLRQPFLLRATAGEAPDLVVAALQLGRYDQLSYRNGELVLRQAPEPNAEAALGFLVVPQGEGPRWLAAAVEVLTSCERPLPLLLGSGGEAVLLSQAEQPWSRLVALPDAPATPCFVREQGWWTWRGTQPNPDGGRWLRVWQTPGDQVAVLAGPALFARTHPGPGSLRLMQLREPSPHGVEVRVLQPSRLGPPCVVMAADFDEVLLDGKPWAHFDGRTVYLPDRCGSYRITTRRAGGESPHVRRTRAPLEACFYEPATKQLVLLAGNEPGRPPELRWTAVLAGPRPTRVENGEIVPVSALHLPDVEQEALAAAGGVLVRFGSGGAKVIYGE
ncbi:MAG: hypothetical protein IT455_18080 [Planctomycetes bacterium]|nr:hypothetical protein [Planctomycetota bacterium]